MKKPLFNKVVIVGVGLIGGSLGLAIKKRKLAKEVVGVFRHRDTLAKALKKRAVDYGTFDLKSAARDADLVILCTPILSIIHELKILRNCLKKNALVIDVGSSKVEINHMASRVLRHGVFVGCHPMAGSEKQGVGNADAKLFEGSVCFMTSRNNQVERFWKLIGAKRFYLPADAHDAWVAKASHLPHLLAFTLFQNFGLPKGLEEVNPSLKEFRRLAQSNAGLWADIYLSNRSLLAKTVDGFGMNLKKVRSWLASKNSSMSRRQMTRFISKANKNAAALIPTIR